MLRFSKRALSLYVRTGCDRQFHFYLYDDQEREQVGMPPRQEARAQLGLIGRAGYDWQDEKVSEISEVFGEDRVHVSDETEGRYNRPQQTDLADIIFALEPYEFGVEVAYTADTESFREAVNFPEIEDCYGLDLEISDLVADVVQILPSRTQAENQLVEANEDFDYEIRPDGSVSMIEADDERLRLRVIDIKLASDPGAHYFAEVVYYSMALAAWLTETGLDDQFAVVGAPAVWPGSHEASNLSEAFQAWGEEDYVPSGGELARALEEDLETAPVDAFSARIRKIIQEDLYEALEEPWHEQSFHVGYKCRGCEFIGYPGWQDREGNETHDERHCWPTAERSGHLSRVVGLSEGMTSHLIDEGDIVDVEALSDADRENDVFLEHYGLRAKRTVYPSRAESLSDESSFSIPESGGDGLMPRWPDLKIFTFLDYDLSSAITACFALRAYWREPLPYNSHLDSRQRRWTGSQGFQERFLVEERSVEAERRALLRYLNALRGIMDWVREEDQRATREGRRDGDTQQSSYQIYLWDEAQNRHLERIISRHLGAILGDDNLHDLAWLFPPPELLDRPEEATRLSPITKVSSVVQNTVAVPVPFHYTLLDVVQEYRPDGFTPPTVHPLYQEPFSDLTPGERIHEYWEGIGDEDEKRDQLAETTINKVSALGMVVWRLENDLQDVLSRSAAPPLAPPPDRPDGLSPHGHLWHEFSKLDGALERLDAYSTYSMPPHEREARFKSAILTRRLEGLERARAIQNINRMVDRTLVANSELLVYELAEGSVDVNVREGDINYVLSPMGEPNFLDNHPYPRLVDRHQSDMYIDGESIRESRSTGVSVEGIDRVNGYIALSPGFKCEIRLLEQGGAIDFTEDVILDYAPKDYQSKKIRKTLRAIGCPPIAYQDERVLEALGVQDLDVQDAEITPVSRFLWEAPQVEQEGVERDADQLLDRLEEEGIGLNASQADAVSRALTHRITLLWGPPGTGKSWTLRAIVLAAVTDAIEEEGTVRIIVTAGTYTAVDNVLTDVAEQIEHFADNEEYNLSRLQSGLRPDPIEIMNNYENINCVQFGKWNAPNELISLKNRLGENEGIEIIFTTAHQMYNLAVARDDRAQERVDEMLREWFDVILIDEASQLETGLSTLVLSKISEGGQVILAGDDLQLPPIHNPEYPEGLENVVGSSYNFFRQHHNIEPTPLQVNYRSNETLVSFTRQAGYDESLRSFSPKLRLNYHTKIPVEEPEYWPDQLCWTSEWRNILDPGYPAISYIYTDNVSSQVNNFEADSVASLVKLLFHHHTSQLANERIPGENAVEPLSDQPYDPNTFWNRFIGVVTPHRAQMSKIIHRLQSVFPDHPGTEIRDAVDTVERFQGQQRDVMIASLGVGDPDLIEQEDEFLYSLNRFNVLSSRARAKLVVLAPQTLIDYLSDDSDVLQESRLIKTYTESFCKGGRPVELGFFDSNNQIQTKDGLLRRRVID